MPVLAAVWISSRPRHPASEVGRAHTIHEKSPVGAPGASTRTYWVVPFSAIALPYFPAVVHVAPTSVPGCPLPDTSAVVVPAPSSNGYAATSVARMTCPSESTTYRVLQGPVVLR